MKNLSNKEYQNMIAPYEKSPWGKNLLWAFVSGGLLCILGQGIASGAVAAGLSKEDAGCVVSICLIFLSGLLTGLGLWDKFAKRAGAGAIVPITGFANAMISPAMEFKSEGYVLGMGAKMFVIAGPVIVYGVSASVIGGWIYFLVKGGLPL